MHGFAEYGELRFFSIGWGAELLQYRSNAGAPSATAHSHGDATRVPC
jgi:hypothetical protein